MKISIEMTSDEFEHLWHTGADWGPHWQEQSDRFANLDGTEIDWTLTSACWFADMASVILARAYLTGAGARTQVLIDNTDGHYVIISD